MSISTLLPSWWQMILVSKEMACSKLYDNDKNIYILLFCLLIMKERKCALESTANPVYM